MHYKRYEDEIRVKTHGGQTNERQHKPVEEGEDVQNSPWPYS